jgi:hypothetical protein
MSFLIIPLCHPEPLGDKLDIRSAGLDPSRRLLLKGVQHINRPLETHRVHGAVRGTVAVFYDLQDARPEPFQGFAERCLPPNWATLSAVPM